MEDTFRSQRSFDSTPKPSFENAGAFERSPEGQSDVKGLKKRLGQAVASPRGLMAHAHSPKFAPVLLQELVNILDAEAGSLYIRKNMRFELTHAVGEDPVPSSLFFTFNANNVFQALMNQGKSLKIEDLRRRSDLAANGLACYQEGSLLSLPVLDKEGSLYAFFCIHKHQPAAFTTTDQELGDMIISFTGDTLYAAQNIKESEQHENVTNLRQAEEERFRLATAIQQTSELIFIMDGRGLVQYVNPSFESVTGYTKDEIIDKNAKLLIKDKQDIDIYRDIWHTVSHGNVWKGKLINKKKDGSLYHVESTVSPIRNESGKIINYVSVNRDITKESMLEKQLSQAQKMEAIGTLAGGIAHDFNNVLSSVIGYTELSQLEINNPEKCQKHLNKVIMAANRAKDLVTQILSFSRSEKNELMPIDLWAVINEATKLLRASLPTTIEIRKKVHTNHRIILADPTQIHQVIMNICTNAAHAMRQEGGTLDIVLEDCADDTEFALQFPNQNAGRFLSLTLRDAGIGMTNDVIKRIFDPYFTTKDKGEGTGLGLAIVHGIVQRHNGQITVASSPGQGTQFHIYLPHTNGDVDKFSNAISEAIPRGNEKIILVDDESDIIYVGERMLEHLGYKIRSFTSSTEALKAVKADPNDFDVLITDMTMPILTGDQLAIKVKEIRPDLPVLLCTGYNEKISRKKALEIGIDDFLMKPSTLMDLAKSLRNILDNRKGKGHTLCDNGPNNQETTPA